MIKSTYGRKEASTKVRLSRSPNARKEDGKTVLERIPSLPFNHILGWIKSWISDVEEIFGCSSEKQEEISDHFYSQIDAIAEAAGLLNKRCMQMDALVKLTETKVSLLSGRLERAEEKATRCARLRLRLLLWPLG